MNNHSRLWEAYYLIWQCLWPQMSGASPKLSCGYMTKLTQVHHWLNTAYGLVGITWKVGKRESLSLLLHFEFLHLAIRITEEIFKRFNFTLFKGIGFKSPINKNYQAGFVNLPWSFIWLDLSFSFSGQLSNSVKWITFLFWPGWVA